MKLSRPGFLKEFERISTGLPPDRGDPGERCSPQYCSPLFFRPLQPFRGTTIAIQRTAACRRLLPAVLTALFICSPAFAQRGAPDSSDSFNPIARGLKDLWIQTKAPFTISSEDAPWVIAGAASFGGLLLSDQSLHDAVDPVSLRGSGTEDAAHVVTSFGATSGIALLAGFTAYGFVARDDKALETSYLAGEAFVASGIWTQVLKALAGRERPSVKTRSGGKWTGPFGSSFTEHFSRFDSFPSGHTQTAFSIATVFAEQYSETPLVPVLSYGIAGFVGVSRVVLDRHWPSDVFAGGIIGYLCAQQVMSNNPSELSRSRDRSQIGWILVPQSKGFSLVVRF